MRIVKHIEHKGPLEKFFIEGLEINSPEYWEIRHQRDEWPRSSSWALDIACNNILPDSSVLIIGCGQGMEAIGLLKRIPEINNIYAFDVSPTAIKKANENLVNNYPEFKDKIIYFCEDVFNLKLDKQFDYGITIQNLEHWTSDLHILAIKKMFKHIKEKGRLFITGVGRSWDLSLIGFNTMVYNGKEILTPDDYHYVNWSEQDIYDLFMSNVEFTSITFFRKRGKDRVIAEILK